MRYIRKIRDAYMPGEQVRDPDHATSVAALFKAHPDFEMKRAGRELSHFEVRAYKYQTRAFFAVFTNGEFIDFSFKKAVNQLFGAA
jgi:hypothetical protein